MIENTLNLYMILIGCTPKNRLTEQHDIFFGIGHSISELIPYIEEFWPECEGKFHIDCWRKVSQVGAYAISIEQKEKAVTNNTNLFFLNLGGYLQNSFEEFHYKELLVATSTSEAIKQIKKTDFYESHSFKGAESHIDDNHGIDIDDIFKIKDVLLPIFKNKYQIKIERTNNSFKDQLHIGYLPISKIIKNNL